MFTEVDVESYDFFQATSIIGYVLLWGMVFMQFSLG